MASSLSLSIKHWFKPREAYAIGVQGPLQIQLCITFQFYIPAYIQTQLKSMIFFHPGTLWDYKP